MGISNWLNCKKRFQLRRCFEFKRQHHFMTFASTLMSFNQLSKFHDRDIIIDFILSHYATSDANEITFITSFNQISCFFSLSLSLLNRSRMLKNRGQWQDESGFACLRPWWELLDAEICIRLQTKWSNLSWYEIYHQSFKSFDKQFSKSLSSNFTSITFKTSLKQVSNPLVKTKDRKSTINLPHTAIGSCAGDMQL